MGSSPAEKRFLQLTNKGLFSFPKKGWPDFFVQCRETKEFFFVEVKQGADRITSVQRVMFASLESAGFKVVVWNPHYPDGFTPWRAYKPGLRNNNLSGSYALYIRLHPTALERIDQIARTRGSPYTRASVTSEMLIKGLKISRE